MPRFSTMCAPGAPNKWASLMVPAALSVVAALAAAGPVSSAAAAERPPAHRVEGQRSVGERLRGQFARAENLFRSGEPERALDTLSAVIAALDPETAVPVLDAEGRGLLIRSLAYRADVHLLQGERSAADSDLERILTLYPRSSIDGFQLTDAVMDRFERAQGRLLGTLTLSVIPFDARVSVDGVDLPPGTTTYQVLAGNRFVEASLPGFTGQSEEVEVRADRAQEVAINLHRVSAVLKLVTRPVGATVVVDGNAVGTTSGVAPPDWSPQGEAARYPRQEFSSEMEIEGLMPGEHEVEVFLDGYRSFSAPVTIPDLADYHVGGIVLERNVGLVLMRGLSQEAEVWVDGRRTQPEPPSRSPAGEVADLASEAYRLSLAPGEYRVTVSQADAGVYEETVTVADRRNVALDIRLRPGLTFLGVLGEDRLGAEATQETLTSAFAGLRFWTCLDRGEEAERVLQRAGVDAPRMRAVAAAGRPSEALDWARLQATTSRELPGSMFVLAVLGEGELAADANLWVWTGAPGPSVPERLQVSLTDRRGLEEVAQRLSRSMSFDRTWFGAQLIDSAAAAAPVVAGVTPGSPAATAGLIPGDEVVSLAGNVVGTVANAEGWLQTFRAGSTIVVGLRGAGGERTADVRLEAGPVIVSPNDSEELFSVVWAMAAAAVGRLDAGVPSWVTQLNQASVLIHARSWEAAADLLRTIQAPSGPGVGQGLADYWLGIALAESGDVSGAREALESAADRPLARYLRNDGPYLAPLARARLYGLETGRD